MTFCFLLLQCNKDSVPTDASNILQIPLSFTPPPIPADNTITLSRWQLGKKLFYDVALSRDSSISCAHCHQPDLAFTSGTPTAKGVDDLDGTRNVPSLGNIAYHPYYTREGGVPTLEMQILIPAQEHNEFDLSLLKVAERLKSNSFYVQLAQEAYERDPDPFVITRSISCFERTLLTGNSPYDQWKRGNMHALNPDEIQGMRLFFSPITKCSECHHGDNFTDYSFKNNGLYKDYPDPGRFRLTNDPMDLALFKVPSLRNVGVTAPYMHDGSIQTLEEVVEHYVGGGKHHIHQDDRIQPIALTQQQKKQLVLFLKSLTDLQFIHDSRFRN